MKPVDWNCDEKDILSQFGSSNKSAYQLYRELLDAGYKRSYKAVLMALERYGLRKPMKYKLGHYKSIAYVDIEATNLNAPFGFVLSWAIKYRDREVISRRITEDEIYDGTLDRDLLQDFLDELKNVDVLVTYYGTGFDNPFVRTRCEYWGLDFPHFGEKKHLDMFYVVRYKLKLGRGFNSLDSVCRFLGIKGKTHINPATWIRAMTGDTEALNYVFRHNIQDVRILEKLHRRLEKYIKPTHGGL